MTTFLLLIFATLELSFESRDIGESIEQKFNFYSSFSSSEKSVFCAEDDDLSCIFLFLDKFYNENESAEMLLAGANSYLHGKNREIAIYFLIKNKWRELEVEDIKNALSSLPEEYYNPLYRLYLRKLYFMGNYQKFFDEYIPIRDEELTLFYVAKKVIKDPIGAFTFVRELDHNYSEGFYDKTKKLLDKHLEKFWKKRLRSEYRIWVLDYNYNKIRYKQLINLSSKWFKKKKFRNIYDWRANLYKAMAYTKRREHSKAISVYRKLEKYLDKFELTDVDIFRFYRWSGYSYAASGNNEKSIDAYLGGYHYFMNREEGASLLYHAADMARLNHDFDQADEFYRKLSGEYPEFGKINVVEFLLFWINYKQKKFDDAEFILNKIIKRHSSTNYSYRRAKYWLGRVLGHKGDQKSAIRIMQEIARDYPATFYGAMAGSRLASNGLKAPLKKEKTEKSQEVYYHRALMDETMWIAALYSLGKQSSVRKFLYLFRNNIRNEGEENDKLILSFIARKTGLHSMSTSILKSMPKMSEKTSDYIKLQYPVNYEEEICSHADFYKVPALFVFSIARQESLFNTNAVSSAYALGLLQILPTTAQLLANREGYGKVVDRNLKKPLTNVRFGIKFLGILLRKYNESIPLASAAYNAGPGKINKWLRRNPEMELDEFIEDIPIFQTRNYVKKVMRNYAMYHFLYKGTVYKSLELKLPKIK